MTEKQDQSQDTTRENPLSALRRKLTTPGPWAERFRRLALAVARVQDVTCEECQSSLDMYVHAELAGEDVRKRYPALWLHIHTCAECSLAHTLVLESLSQGQEQQSGHANDPNDPVVRSAVDLPFLSRPPADAPWVIRKRSPLAGRGLYLSIHLRPTYLWQLVASPDLGLQVRGEALRADNILLVTDAVSWGEQDLVIEAVAERRAEQLDTLHLRVHITSSESLPENLWVMLRWGNEVRDGKVPPGGRADLGEVSLGALKEALKTGTGAFEITFEQRY